MTQRLELKKKRGTPFKMKALLIFAVTCLVCSVSVAAFARDRDGTKIQARALQRESRHTDSLAPPEDVADWFYIKVDTKGHVRVTLETSLPFNITVFNSSNESKWSRSNAIGVTTVSLDVEPGIYFISISVPSQGKPMEMPYTLKVD